MSSKTTSVWHYLLAGILLSATLTVHADDNDPPARVARLAYAQGGVSFRPAGADEWIEAAINRPLTVGDQLWSDRDGRIEMQLDGSNLRLGTETAASILNLTDDATQIQLSSGTLIVHVRQLADDESYEIDTPNVAFSILRPGTYRLSVEPNGASTAIAVRSGQGEAVGGNGTGYTVRAGEYDTFAGTEQIDADSAALGPQDEFDAWSAERDGRFDTSRSAQYVSPDVVGYEELDTQGNWDDTPEYGHVWFPSSVETGWAPYHRGHWAYVAPWGYTWIDEQRWGFAPFHYGRWVYWRQRWGWVPVPPPAPRVVYVRPVYAPALVAWVGSGATVAWFPLGPREVFVPSYPVSRRYLNVVNVSNTRINTTVINNVYNTTIINRTTINNVTYANRRVPGAVMVTSSQDFASARPVRRDGGGDARLGANAPVRAFAPAVVPTRAAVYGGRAAADRRPPQAVQTRVTAARMAPAAAAPSLDARLQALRAGGGAPGRTPPPRAAAPADAPQVRVVPPVRTLVSSRDFDNVRPQGTAAAPATGSGAPPAHARELLAGPRAPSPAAANSVLERQQSQEQQQLQARQDAERQRVQQQQDQQHRRFTDGQAADARRQQLDQQQAAQHQAQSQASAELARRQQLDQQRGEQQRNAQLEQLQAQQRAQADSQARVQQQAQAQAEQQRAAQLDRQRALEQQVQQQHNAQLAQQQEQQRAQAASQARIQQQAQAQAEQQKNQQLERQRADAQVQYQRQQQALDQQRQTRERQMEQQHQQQTQQLQQQQTRAREDMQERQQAVQRQVEQQRRPTPQTPRQPH